jgi:pilus assembly protein CpaF
VTSSSLATGYGELDRWLADPLVNEVLVNAGGEVWVERQRGPEYMGSLAPGALEGAIERILMPIGRRLDRASPIVDARLADGSRICAVLPPVAVDGPCLAVRRFSPRPIAVAAFASPDVVALLNQVVVSRCNVLVAGATSSGKTTLLNALTALVDTRERVVTLEDTAELRIDAPHVLRLETRPGTAEGLAPIDLAALVRTALRLRPDRLVVGEIRGDEATDLVQALNTGHDGSLATMHANSPTDALARLESLVVRASSGWPLHAVREQVHRSIDVVVQVQRSTNGVRRIVEVAEVAAVDDMAGGAGATPRTRPLSDGEHVIGQLQRGRR